MKIEKTNRILLSSFWINRFRLNSKEKYRRGRKKKKYFPINQKRGLEQRKGKNISNFLPFSSKHDETRNETFLSQIHFHSPYPLFPNPIPKYPYRKCIETGFKTSQLSIDIQHLGNRSSIKFPPPLSLSVSFSL